MRDLTPKSAFGTPRQAVPGDGVVAAEISGMAIATVMARRDRSAALSEAVRSQFGLALPTGATWAAASTVTFLGIAPDKWLAIGDAQTRDFVPMLESKLQGLASVVEQSGGLGLLRLGGPAVHDVLEKGVQIDLSPSAFPAGSVAVTSIAHVGVTLWKLDDAPTFALAVARSLASSFLHWLDASAAPRGPTVDASPP